MGIVKLLVNHGADVNVTDNAGRTPLYSLVKEPRHYYWQDTQRDYDRARGEIISFLETKGAVVEP